MVRTFVKAVVVVPLTFCAGVGLGYLSETEPVWERVVSTARHVASIVLDDSSYRSVPLPKRCGPFELLYEGKRFGLEEGNTIEFDMPYEQIAETLLKRQRVQEIDPAVQACLVRSMQLSNNLYGTGVPPYVPTLVKHQEPSPADENRYSGPGIGLGGSE